MIKLEILNLNNFSSDYLMWMNDLEVHKYTEQKYKKHTINDLKKFIIEKIKSNDEYLYGIFLLNNNKHIGNIKLGPIYHHHKTAFISYFIGDKNEWRKGYGSLAIKMILKEAKIKKLKKIKASLYANNKSSIGALIKNNFKLEGECKKDVIYKQKRISSLVYGKIL